MFMKILAPSNYAYAQYISCLFTGKNKSLQKLTGFRTCLTVCKWHFRSIAASARCETAGAEQLLRLTSTKVSFWIQRCQLLPLTCLLMLRLYTCLSQTIPICSLPGFRCLTPETDFSAPNAKSCFQQQTPQLQLFLFCCRSAGSRIRMRSVLLAQHTRSTQGNAPWALSVVLQSSEY